MFDFFINLFRSKKISEYEFEIGDDLISLYKSKGRSFDYDNKDIYKNSSQYYIKCYLYFHDMEGRFMNEKGCDRTNYCNARNMRILSCYALLNVVDHNTIELAFSLLNNKDPECREDAASILERLRPDKNIKICLENAILSEPESTAKLAMVQSYSRLYKNDANDFLLRVMNGIYHDDELKSELKIIIKTSSS